MASYARSAKAAGLTRMGLVTCSDGVQVCEDTARSVPEYVEQYGMRARLPGQRRRWPRPTSPPTAWPPATPRSRSSTSPSTPTPTSGSDGPAPASATSPSTASPSRSCSTEAGQDPNLQGSPGVSYTAPFFFDANPAIAEFHAGDGPVRRRARRSPVRPASGGRRPSCSRRRPGASRATPTSADILEGAVGTRRRRPRRAHRPAALQPRRADRPTGLLLAGRRGRQQLPEPRRRPAALRARTALACSRLTRRAVVVLGLLRNGDVAVAVAVATAATGGAFRGVAAAEGVRIGVVGGGAPVTNQVVDGASPIAQAALDSTAGSSALGSVAYPGDLVVTAPGLRRRRSPAARPAASSRRTRSSPSPGRPPHPRAASTAPGSAMRAHRRRPPRPKRRPRSGTPHGRGRPGSPPGDGRVRRGGRRRRRDIAGRCRTSPASTIGPLVARPRHRPQRGAPGARRRSRPARRPSRRPASRSAGRGSP